MPGVRREAEGDGAVDDVPKLRREVSRVTGILRGRAVAQSSAGRLAT